jgi:hypothetical protein
MREIKVMAADGNAYVLFVIGVDVALINCAG